MNGSFKRKMWANHPNFLALALCTAGVAQGTYSIVAADRDTRQIGFGNLLCVRRLHEFSVAPGIGGINAQAYSNAAGRDLLCEPFGRLRCGHNLNYISSRNYLNTYCQYGIVSFDTAVAYSGSNNGALVLRQRRLSL